MLGAITANATSPVTNGELFKYRTSMGKATVDILLPNMDTEEPPMRIRNAMRFDSGRRKFGDLFSNRAAARRRDEGKPSAPGRSFARRSSETVASAASSPIASRI